jgi:hypothetical protein
MGSTAAPLKKNIPPQGWRSRLFSPELVEFWWLGVPRRLRPYSAILSNAWSDGIYLTAWPRAAILLPAVVLLFGFFEGVTHWSPLTVSNTSLSTTLVAVSLMQIVHLLIIAAVLGSLSADLGLMLVVGFALGDYLIAGPFLTLPVWDPVAGFLYLRLPQLYSYGILFALAVAPNLVSAGLLRPLNQKLRGDGLTSWIIRLVASGLVTAFLVFSWTVLAPLTLRIQWSWTGGTPPTSVFDYRSMMNPWLPLAAVAGVVARAFLVRRARGNVVLRERMRKLWQQAIDADRQLKWPRRQPAWLRAAGIALLSTLLLAGLIASWLLALLVFAVLLAICLTRNCVLPKVSPWMKWSRIVERVPAIVRLAAAIVATYFATLQFLQLPGMSAPANGIPGHFGAELISIGMGVIILTLLLPYIPASSLSAGMQPAPLPRAAIRAAQALLLVWFVFSTVRAHAICLDPSCCFGDNPNAAMAVGIMALGIGIFLLGGGMLIAVAAMDAEAAAAAAAAADALGTADTIAAGLGTADTVAGAGFGAADTVAGAGFGGADTVAGAGGGAADTVAGAGFGGADTVAGPGLGNADTVAGPGFGNADTLPGVGTGTSGGGGLSPGDVAAGAAGALGQGASLGWNIGSALSGGGGGTNTGDAGTGTSGGTTSGQGDESGSTEDDSLDKP